MASCCLLLALSFALMLDRSHSVSCKKNKDRVMAKEGSHAFLPCIFTYREKIDILLIWQIENKSPVVKANSTEKKIWDQFHGRVRLIPEWYQIGNGTLWISNSKISDSGNYTCAVRGDGLAEFCASVELLVKSDQRACDVERAVELLECVWDPMRDTAAGLGGAKARYAQRVRDPQSPREGLGHQ
ncbi:coxsackievirus and adenovirus receptor homolog isoform X2 [Narcine bancroftii]